MFLNFVFFLHLLGLRLSPTALLLTCMIEALFSLGQIIITEYDILHVVSLFKTASGKIKNRPLCSSFPYAKIIFIVVKELNSSIDN